MKNKEEIINIEANGKIYKTFKFDKPASNIEYSDNISIDVKILYSATTSDGYVTDEPIRNLYFSKPITELKIFMINVTNEPISGIISIAYEQDDVDKGSISLYESTSFNYDDILEFGNLVSQEELNNNYFINKNSPVQVKYFRVKPDLDSTDNMLNEYGIKGLSDEKCMSVLSKNNSLPQDEKAVYTEWGYQYTSFAVNIAKLYFEELFGKNESPVKDDFLIFLMGGMMMTVGGVQKVFGANRCLLGWSLSLVHHAINSSVQGTESLDLYAENSENMFRNMKAIDGKDATNQEYNLSSLVHHDYSRSMLSNMAKVIEDDNMNYYSIGNNPEEIAVVTYKRGIVLNESFALSFYHKSDLEDDIIFRIRDILEIGIASSKVYVTWMGVTYLYKVDPDPDEWYVYLANINKSENKIDLISYKISDRSRHSEKHVIEPCSISEDGILSIFSGNSNISRIRAWKKPLPVEFEGRLLFNKIVEKPSSAYVIDNCEVILNSRTHARPDNMERWKDFEENRKPIN